MIHVKRLLLVDEYFALYAPSVRLFKGGVNPDSHGQWVQIDFFDGEFCCGLAGRREQFDVSAGAKH